MKRARLAGAMLALLAATSAAAAADLPTKMAVKAPVVAPLPTWTGLYVGIAGGMGWARDRIEVNPGGFTTPTLTGNGAIFGGTLGYNWQYNALIVGVEGDASWARIDPKGSDATVFPTCTAGGIGTCGTELQFLGTVRGRAGYLITNSVLLYATGGVAFGELNASMNLPLVSVGAKEMRTGWTAGGGVEAMLFGNWTGKIEYLHVDLGNGPSFPVGGLTASSADWHGDIVRVGVNYKLGNVLGR